MTIQDEGSKELFCLNELKITLPKYCPPFFWQIIKQLCPEGIPLEPTKFNFTKLQF